MGFRRNVAISHDFQQKAMFVFLRFSVQNQAQERSSVENPNLETPRDAYYPVRSLSARVTRRAPEIRPLKKRDSDEISLFSSIFRKFRRPFFVVFPSKIKPRSVLV